MRLKFTSAGYVSAFRVAVCASARFVALAIDSRKRRLDPSNRHVKGALGCLAAGHGVWTGYVVADGGLLFHSARGRARF